jgi:hypothetical protein
VSVNSLRGGQGCGPVQPGHQGSRHCTERARAVVTVTLQVTSDSYLFVPLFREAFGLPRNFWPYNFERQGSWELVVETMRAHFAHRGKEIIPASVQVYANGYIDPHDQTRLLTSLETVHADMITRITQFKAQTSHWVHNRRCGRLHANPLCFEHSHLGINMYISSFSNSSISYMLCLPTRTTFPPCPPGSKSRS